jgi:hypothetical protein
VFRVRVRRYSKDCTESMVSTKYLHVPKKFNLRQNSYLGASKCIYMCVCGMWEGSVTLFGRTERDELAGRDKLEGEGRRFIAFKEYLGSISEEESALAVCCVGGRQIRASTSRTAGILVPLRLPLRLEERTGKDMLPLNLFRDSG